MWNYLNNKKLKSVDAKEVRIANAALPCAPQKLDGNPTMIFEGVCLQLNPSSVPPSQAQALMKKGAMLIDVRLGMDFDSQHAAGAVSVPLFRLTAGNSGWDQFKKVVMAGLNMRPTERDPDFVKNVERAVNGNKRKKVILMCTIGGTLDTVVRVASTGKKTETDKDRAFGRESRSLKACYELMWAGFTDVVHLKGGLSEWTYDGNPVEPK